MPQSLAQPDSRIMISRRIAPGRAVVQLFVLDDLAPRLAPLRGHQMSRNPIQIAAKTSPRLIALHVLQKRQKTFLRQLLRPRRVLQPTPKKSIDRLAIALEQLHERLPRSLLELQYELVVAIHKKLPRRFRSRPQTLTWPS